MEVRDAPVAKADTYPAANRNPKRIRGEGRRGTRPRRLLAKAAA